MLLVNLLPWRQRRLRRRARHGLLALLLQLLLAGLLLGMIYSRWHQQYTELRDEFSEVSTQRQQLAAHYQQTRRIRSRLQRYQAQQQADAAGVRHNQRYLGLLEQLSGMMPERLWLTEIADRGTYLSIVGMSENYTDIVSLNHALISHPAVARARVLNAFRQQNVRSLLRFSLQADWKNDESIDSGGAHDQPDD
ncbi:pilus assembly protein HofN|uniref:Pilus assembly protein HofN n=1 Tax=Brenneria salicis ATCC 15712 = DSM 30166 TaxID=714314 RepID=A0A366I2N5_9GAMM|nr:PilN domain-containing protein [Brenneria salicis]NMN90276.1 pilus assembly protein HofN [Brenneria salicis ATCC 15712 = DSM 30166]RBP61200.1 pilus assembly protein HofN [Brenneria salicis ATCC 15712 = DSM 30166]RLM30223.1 hypothetical protein BHG07_11705 [Brenneria salicis ATCC 15712 = DSM 30166]